MADTADTKKLDIAGIAQQSVVPTIVMDRDLRIVFANAAYERAVQKPGENLVGQAVFDVFPFTSDKEIAFRKKCTEAFTGKMTRTAIQPYQQTDADGRTMMRYWQATQEPLRNADGDIEFIMQRVQDVTHLMTLQQSNDAITTELDHRVKNLVTVILATARISSTSAESVQQYTDEFCNRLESMARYYNKLSANGWQGLSLRSMFEDELAQVVGRGAIRYSLKGKDVVLSYKATKDGGMVIHELVANAVKHGCFSQPEGRLDVEWWISEGKLHVIWHETGLTGVREPSKVGFGTKLLSMLPNAEVHREFRDTGLWLNYVIPVNLATGGYEFDDYDAG